MENRRAIREPEFHASVLMGMDHPLNRPLLALVLLAPVPTIGVTSAMILCPGPVGQSIFMAAKIWLVALPFVWHLAVDRHPASWSPTTGRHLLAGLGLGVAMAAIIVGAYALIGASAIDPEELRREITEMGLGTPAAYLGAALAWSLANSLMEEIVYRWFLFTRCAAVLSARAAVLLSAAVFTLHHTVALSTYLTPGLNALASLGIFIAGAIWSETYRRTGSIWPVWVSHIIADLAIFACGWLILTN
jgi:membrane protease YdiL (CAAX protease family)